ncbi:GWT1-domain-containing protein [Sodiomyces alkalinus F11]|uniref:GPI-anchored wall transfer protein 1 n=1 Tax=Sodiomyces alkalinus (strain CBS 110278 / VKM F-3762 / F11) TaxID=1314773 RepID=A0A3N2Q007_SODAK|nr:GWT1-domain-containing protein [Sodiomyces alkalinus F11]ROT40016.1 GWT1-domain-containing protein [Sodiomyces alkalinus F11]
MTGSDPVGVATAAAGYKKLKEDFVSNLSGGSPAEINYVTAVAPVAILLWSALQSRQSLFKANTPFSLLVDYLINVAPILLSVTLYSGTPLLLNALLLAPALFVYALPRNVSAPRKKLVVPPNNVKSRTATPAGPLAALPPKPFLTNYRGGMLVITTIAILAVDFRLFPRRFAKVETWGTSLMDLGVGSFVFSAGVIAARPVLRERASGRSASLATRLRASLRHSLPLLALGFVRLLSVKGLDYAEHVSEYGVHWNFFFTLGLLPPFTAAFQSALNIVPSYAALSVLLGVAYQVLLESTPLKAYVLTAPRTDLLSANREGVFSFLGYLAIFLAGQDTGMYILPRHINPRRDADPATQRTTLLMTMAVWSAIWSALYFLTTSYTWGDGLSVSRRLANLPYVFWVAAFNSAHVLAYCLVETLFFPAAFHHTTDARAENEAYDTATSRVLHAYNRNGLAVFLLANLLTGLVNLTVPTLDAGPVATMAILVAYTGTLTAVALGLDAYDISLKLHWRMDARSGESQRGGRAKSNLGRLDYPLRCIAKAWAWFGLFLSGVAAPYGFELGDRCTGRETETMLPMLPKVAKLIRPAPHTTLSQVGKRRPSYLVDLISEVYAEAFGFRGTFRHDMSMVFGNLPFLNTIINKSDHTNPAPT